MNFEVETKKYSIKGFKESFSIYVRSLFKDEGCWFICSDLIIPNIRFCSKKNPYKGQTYLKYV